MTERVSVTVGFAGLPMTKGFSGRFESPGIAKPPSNAETLRHIADSISGDEPMNRIFAGMLTRAAAELDGQFEALKLAVGMLNLHGYEGDAKKVVAESKRWKSEADAQPKAG
jgi:hypothetical protein